MLLSRKDNWNFPTIMSDLVFIHHDCIKTDVLTKCSLVRMRTATNYWCDVMWCDGYISDLRSHIYSWCDVVLCKDYTTEIILQTSHTPGIPPTIPLCHHPVKHHSHHSHHSHITLRTINFIIVVYCCEDRPEVVVDNHRILGSSDMRSVTTLTLATVRPHHQYCYHRHHGLWTVDCWHQLTNMKWVRIVHQMH